MAADFEYALDPPTITPSHRAKSVDSSNDDGQHSRSPHDGDGHGLDRWDGHRPIVLDADLPPPTMMSEITGLDELSMIERAVGIMIDQGHHPDHARAMLRRHAAAAGVEPQIYAARLLRPWTAPRPPQTAVSGISRRRRTV